MRLFIDSAEPAVVQRALATGYAAGVTTNPTLLRRAGLHRADLPAIVKAAADRGAGEIHLQVFSPAGDVMVTEGRELQALDRDRVVVKVPATGAGFAAAAQLASEGVRVTVTAVYAVRQIVLAEAVGARYAAVYLGRMRDAGGEPEAVIGAMLNVIRAQDMGVRLLVASVRTAVEVETLAALGAHSATLPPEVFFTLPSAAGSEEAARAFQEDAAHL